MKDAQVLVSLSALREIKLRLAEAIIQLDFLPNHVKKTRVRFVKGKGEKETIALSPLNTRRYKEPPMQPIDRALYCIQFAAAKLHEELKRVDGDWIKKVTP